MARRVIQARDIRDLPQGSRVFIEGRKYVRGMDFPDYHMEDLLVDPETGWIGQWYRLVLGDVEVEYEHP